MSRRPATGRITNTRLPANLGRPVPLFTPNRPLQQADDPTSRGRGNIITEDKNSVDMTMSYKRSFGVPAGAIRRGWMETTNNNAGHVAVYVGETVHFLSAHGHFRNDGTITTGNWTMRVGASFINDREDSIIDVQVHEETEIPASSSLNLFPFSAIGSHDSPLVSWTNETEETMYMTLYFENASTSPGSLGSTEPFQSLLMAFRIEERP